MTKHILLLHGPNLNLLGTRQPDVYGSMTLDEINAAAQRHIAPYDAELRTAQSNHEGELIDLLHDARSWAHGIVFNPGAYTHSSLALRDAIETIEIPVIEVHISNIHGREVLPPPSPCWPASASGKSPVSAGTAICSPWMRCCGAGTCWKLSWSERMKTDHSSLVISPIDENRIPPLYFA